jgi:hypothetical protein
MKKITKKKFIHKKNKKTYKIIMIYYICKMINILHYKIKLVDNFKKKYIQ